MATYTVHCSEAAEDVTFVPEGFSVVAFLFTAVWAFWKRMWIIGLLAVMVLAGLAVLPSVAGLSPLIASLIQLAVSVLFGFEANSLRRLALARAGYEEVAVVSGDTLEAAELRYFASRPVAAPTPDTGALRTAPARYAHDTLGLFGNV